MDVVYSLKYTIIDQFYVYWHFKLNAITMLLNAI